MCTLYIYIYTYVYDMYIYIYIYICICVCEPSGEVEVKQIVRRLCFDWRSDTYHITRRSPSYVALHYITLHYITLHYITYVCIYTYTYIYIYIYIRYIYMYTYIHIYIYTYVCMYVYIYMAILSHNIIIPTTLRAGAADIPTTLHVQLVNYLYLAKLLYSSVPYEFLVGETCSQIQYLPHYAQ